MASAAHEDERKTMDSATVGEKAALPVKRPEGGAFGRRGQLRLPHSRLCGALLATYACCVAYF